MCDFADTCGDLGPQCSQIDNAGVQPHCFISGPMDERDERLMEAMGYPVSVWGAMSEWDKFGALLKWAQKQEWWSDFIYDYSELNTAPLDSGPYPEHAVAAFDGMTPEHFANAVDFYLQGRG